LRINTTPLQSFLQTVVEISLQSHRYTYVASFFVTFFLDLIVLFCDADRRGGQGHDQGRIYKMTDLSWQVYIHALFLFFYSIGGFYGKHTMFLLLCSLMVAIQTFWFQKVSSTTLLVMS
jgi:hypothetical protein